MARGSRRGVLISGFYGFGNVGDEAVLAGLLAGLRGRLGAIPVTVLSGDPAFTTATHGVEALDRLDARGILRALRRVRLFVSGGGSLIQDATSARSALYYLGLLWLAAALVPRTMVYASGIGPLSHGAVRRLAAGILGRVDAVTVRDPDSAALVRALAPGTSPVLCADPAVLLNNDATAAEAADRLLERLGAKAPLIGVAVRPWKGDAHLQGLAEGLRAAAGRLGAGILIVPFHPVLDLSLSRDLASGCGGMVVEEPLAPADALALVGRMRLLVGLRYHALLFAAMRGVPPVGIAYDPKVTALLRDLGAGEALGLRAGPEAIAAAVERAWRGSEGHPDLGEAVARMRTRAGLAADEAARLYATA